MSKCPKVFLSKNISIAALFILCYFVDVRINIVFDLSDRDFRHGGLGLTQSLMSNYMPSDQCLSHLYD